MQKIRFLTAVPFLYGLAYECPLFIRIDHCPFSSIQHLSFKEKVDWIDKLSIDKQRSIFNQHLACIKDRENNRE